MKPVVALQDSPSRGICEGDILRPSDDGYVKSISNSFRAFKVDAIPTRKATLLEDYIDSSYVGYDNVETHYLINAFDINDWVYTIKNVHTIPRDLYEEVCDKLEVRVPDFLIKFGYRDSDLHLRMHTSLESHGFVLKESWSKYYTEQIFEDFDDFMNFITSPSGSNIHKYDTDVCKEKANGDCKLEWPDHGKMLNLSPTFLKFLELKYPASGKVDRNTRYFNNDAIGVAWNPAGFWLFSHSSSKPEIKIEDYATYMLDELKAAAPANEMFANDPLGGGFQTLEEITQKEATSKYDLGVFSPSRIGGITEAVGSLKDKLNDPTYTAYKSHSQLESMTSIELVNYYKLYGILIASCKPKKDIIDQGEYFLQEQHNKLNNNKLNNHEETNLFREKNGKIARISDSGFTIRSRTKQITGRTGSISNSQRPCKRRTIVGKPAKF